MNEYEIKIIPHNSAEYYQSVELRSKYLRIPLGLNFSDEELEQENTQIHIVVLMNNNVVGCIVLVPNDENSIKMRQFIVDEDVRGKGIGKALILFSEKYAIEHSYKHIILNARSEAVSFYENLGYSVVSDKFIEVTIPHFNMSKYLG